MPMIAGNGQVPNYRGIVQQFGPAVVGITVAGTQKPEGPQQGRLAGPDLRGIPRGGRARAAPRVRTGRPG